jgi:hypothetical protein
VRKVGTSSSDIPAQSISNKGAVADPKNLQCPDCRSSKLWKSGLYRGRQRWLCRICGYRFSESVVKSNILCQNSELFHSSSDLAKQMVRGRKATFKKSSDGSLLFGCEDVRPQNSLPLNITTVGKDLNALLHYNSDCRICAPKIKAAKNLVRVENAEKERPEARQVTKADIKGLLVNYIAKSELSGLKSKTIQNRLNIIKLLVKRGANLLDPENMFKTIDHAKRLSHKTQQLLETEWTEGSKNNAAQAYKSFCEINKITIPEHINFEKWTRQTIKLPWIPLERRNRRINRWLQSKNSYISSNFKRNWSAKR